MAGFARGSEYLFNIVANIELPLGLIDGGEDSQTDMDGIRLDVVELILLNSGIELVVVDKDD